MVGSGILDDQEIEITLSYPDEDSESSAIVPSITLPNMKDRVVGADKAPILNDNDPPISKAMARSLRT